MATLYYVSIIHSIEDYGSLQEAISGAFVREYGKTTFSHIQEKIRTFWATVEERIETAIPDPRGLLIYHDGFPVGSPEKVLMLFAYMLQDHPKSQNFFLIKKLLDKGALLEGTEDMALVLEQMQIYERIVSASSKEEQQRIAALYADRAQELVGLRDDYIAQRICDTLPDDGRGILFLGRDHNIVPKLVALPRNITIVQLQINL